MAEAGVLVQAATQMPTGQDAQGPEESYDAMTPTLTNDANSPGDAVPGLGVDPKPACAEKVVTRSEKEIAAKAALQDATRKLRELTETTSYDIVQDVDDFNKATAQLFGAPEVKPPPPPPPVKRARPRHRNAFDVECQRPCKVQRASLEEWPPKNFRNDYDSETESESEDEREDERPASRANRLPVIQAFYRNIPTTLANPSAVATEEDFKDAHGMSRDREKPVKVLIHSKFLVKDLENICGLRLPNQPHVLIPPFKLLVHNWADIQDALVRMQDEQKASVSEEQGNAIDIPPSTSDEQLQNLVPEDQHQSDKDADQDTRSDDVPELFDANQKLVVRISHLKLLIDFIRTDLAHLIGLRVKIRDATLDSISFEELYHLYAPGDLIINRKANVDHLHQVYAVTGGRARLGQKFNPNYASVDYADDSPDAGNGTWTDVVIDCFRMRWDGLHIGPFRFSHRIRHYVGERKITDLDFYPVRFREDHESICKALEVRGKKLVECHGHMKYEGLTVDDTGRQPMPPASYDSNYGKPPPLTYESIAVVSQGGQEIEGDVYVDMKTYYQTLDPVLRVFAKLRRAQPSVREVTENLPYRRRELDFHSGDHDVDEARSDAFLSESFHLINPKTPEELDGRTGCLALLSHAVPAYEFRSREWIWIDITKVELIDKTEETRTRGWEDLVIDTKYRRLLESLVNNHMSPAEQRRSHSQLGNGTPTSQIDIIQGKGRGLIILLYGPPGTGKTSTAEAIAAYTGKPLYAITCGDIGLVPDDVEYNLQRHTRLAEKWGCVLLLDEADVFLARRSWKDVKRNSLVSVFLRRLEYYSGILFLTTNMVGIIDEAFKSRIHVALRYNKIGEDTTSQIWQNLLRRIERDNRSSTVKIRFDEQELLDFALEHYEDHVRDESTWNARQIRNAFSTAIAMGQFDRLERIRKAAMSPEAALASGSKSLTTIKLTKRNFLKIADISNDFEHYIKAVRGNDAETALLNEHRDDAYEPDRMPAMKKYNHRSAYDDDYALTSGRRRGYQSASQPSRSAPKGKSVARKSSNWDEDDARDSGVDESQHDSDVRPRRARRSRKVSSDEESDRYSDD